jgi:hypothetical protein
MGKVKELLYVDGAKSVKQLAEECARRLAIEREEYEHYKNNSNDTKAS